MGIMAFVIGSVLCLAAGTVMAQTPCVSDAQTVDTEGRLPVALVLDSEITANLIEGNSLAPGRCFQTLTVQSFIDQLKALNKAKIPIATLSITSHGKVGIGHLKNEGAIFFEKRTKDNGAISLTDLTKKIKEDEELKDGFHTPPNRVSFRGCVIGGGSVESLDNFRKAIGAAIADATNCFTVPQQLGTITLPIGPGGTSTSITKLKQLQNKNQVKMFTKTLRKEIDENFSKHESITGTTLRHSKRCIITLKNRLAAVESNPNGLDDTAMQYFLNKGDLASVWTNITRHDQFDDRSTCFFKLKPHRVTDPKNPKEQERLNKLSSCKSIVVCRRATDRVCRELKKRKISIRRK